ncbi:MAG TPA: hypothetical protein VIY47_15455 [Ignavibacteriaceae bacterium]
MTEDETFNRLRRVPFNEACAIYSIACINSNLRSNASREDLNRAAEKDLRIAGWTIDELNEESVRLNKLDDN